MTKTKLLNIDAEFEGVSFDEANISRTTANKLTAQDPRWLTKTREKNAKLAKDPEWRAALISGIDQNIESYRKAAQEREADPEFREKRVGALREALSTEEYKEKHAAGIDRMKKDPNWRAATKRANQDPKRRAKHSASVSGDKHSQFKGWMVGTNKKTGEEVRFAGAAALEAAGFIYAHVCCCVNGKPGFKSHKGYTWRREE